MKATTAGVLLFLLLAFPVLLAQPEQGTVCVAPNPAGRPTRFLVFYNPDTLTIKVDKRQPIPWPHKEGVRINALDVNERHLIVVTSDGKPIQSFWFRFAEYKTNHLCVQFDGFPASLDEEKTVPWCKCK
jgi:hypothetical protein